jgi:V/A-type H+-transporting ATPase subunit C
LSAGYAFISAYLKGEEARVLSSEHLDGITRTSGVQEVLEAVRETDAGRYLEGVAFQNFDELDEHLWTYFGECLRRLEWFKGLPGDIGRILNAYVVKYDVLNIKAALQGLMTGKKARRIPVGCIHHQGLLDELFNAPDVAGIAALLNGCRLGAYASILEGYNLEEGVRSRLQVEAKLDEEYYRSLLAVSAKVQDGAVLVKVFSMLMDLVNLQIVMRATLGGMGSEAAAYTVGGGYIITGPVVRELIALRPGDIPDRLTGAGYRGMVEEIISNYEKTKTLAVVEDTIDRYKLNMFRDVLAPRVLSPLTAVWYLVIKEIEVRNLRLILKAAMDSLSVEEIKSNLVLTS